MIEQTKYEKLFATPLVRYRCDGHEALNAALLKEGRRLRAADPGASKSNRGGWHSSGNLFDDKAEPIVKLRDLAEQAVLEATRKITNKVDPGKSAAEAVCLDERQPSGRFQCAPYPSRCPLVGRLLCFATRGGDRKLGHDRISGPAQRPAELAHPEIPRLCAEKNSDQSRARWCFSHPTLCIGSIEPSERSRNGCWRPVDLVPIDGPRCFNTIED